MADYALETSGLTKVYRTAGGEVNALIDADIRVKKERT